MAASYKSIDIKIDRSEVTSLGLKDCAFIFSAAQQLGKTHYFIGLLEELNGTCT